jgi:selenide,water dikinase
MCAEAGIPIAGGHTIDSVEPIYGLVVMGLVHPKKIKRNADAKAGDKLILGKPLGVGVLSAALKKGRLDATGYEAMIESTTRLNKPGRLLSELEGVHALTDVTGFGLLGHLLEICKGSKLAAALNMRSIPLLSAAEEYAALGCITGASGRNWAAYGKDIELANIITPVQQALLTDPQTSGGLLVSCDASSANQVLDIFRYEGLEHATIIGEMASCEQPRIHVAAT